MLTGDLFVLANLLFQLAQIQSSVSQTVIYRFLIYAKIPKYGQEMLFYLFFYEYLTI